MPIALRRRSLRAPTVTRSLILGQPLSATMECPTRYRPSMASTETIPGFRDRLALYGIDDRTRSLLAEAWPAIRPVWSARFTRYSKRSAAYPASVVSWRATGTWSKSSRWRTSRLSCRASWISVTPNRAGRLSSRRPHWARRPHAQHRRQLCAQGRVRRSRAQASLFPRRGSPRRPGAYRWPSASTSPMP